MNTSACYNFLVVATLTVQVVCGLDTYYNNIFIFIIIIIIIIMKQYTRLLNCNTSCISLCEGNKQNKAINIRRPK